MIGIIDYNMGNLASVRNALSAIGHEDVVIEADPDRLDRYERIILPGVGAFGDAMEHLRERGMDEAIQAYARSGRYVMGICLGMQLLFDSSEEFGNHRGLGLIRGEVIHFDTERFAQPLKVPHMGWNRMMNSEHPLFGGLDEEHYLYFVHSYHARCTHAEDIIAQTHYGYTFTSAVAHENVLGFQPHPEKSHRNGLQILRNFIEVL